MIDLFLFRLLRLRFHNGSRFLRFLFRFGGEASFFIAGSFLRRLYWLWLFNGRFIKVCIFDLVSIFLFGVQ